MATYSALFSSGLLAPRIVRCTTPVLPSSQMALSVTPVESVDRQLSLTPTSPGPISPCSKAPEAPTDVERPKMRRRRPSINIGSSPMALIKSPVRNAGAALQRTGIMSPTRHRAASVGINEAFENNSLFGRLRSGSVSGAANPPKHLRRKIRRTAPLAPPPSAPLPALPTSPSAKCGSSLLPPAILAPMSRQPLSLRSSSTDNVGNLFSPTSFKFSPDLAASHEDAIDEVTMED